MQRLGSRYRKLVNNQRALVTEESLIEQGRYVPYGQLRPAVEAYAKAVLSDLRSARKPLQDIDRRKLRNTTMGCLEILVLFGRQEAITSKLTVNGDPGAAKIEGATLWKSGRDPDTYSIRIADHKTSGTHGPIHSEIEGITASLMTLHLNFGRYQQSDGAQLQFCFNSARSAKKNSHLTGATESLSEVASRALNKTLHVTTSSIRKSVETWAANDPSLSVADRSAICQALMHSPAVAQKHYVIRSPSRTSQAARRLLQNASLPARPPLPAETPTDPVPLTASVPTRADGICVGTAVLKYFNGAPHSGNVVSVATATEPHHKVVYEDGDSEELSTAEVRVLASASLKYCRGSSRARAIRKKKRADSEDDSEWRPPNEAERRRTSQAARVPVRQKRRAWSFHERKSLLSLTVMHMNPDLGSRGSCCDWATIGRKMRSLGHKRTNVNCKDKVRSLLQAEDAEALRVIPDRIKQVYK